MTRREKIADSFNTLYQNVVNKNEAYIKNEAEFSQARDFVNFHYPRLDVSVMEFLAIYMIRHPNGKIKFKTSESDVLDLICIDEKSTRMVGFNYDGIIVKDEAGKLSQKGE